MEYIGTIRILHKYEGSKSEGDYGYLEVDEQTSYQLYQPDHIASDIDWLLPYRDTQVVIEGEEEEYKTICTNSIKTLNHEMS